MTEPTATEEPQAPAEEAPWSPFPGQETAIFEVSKPINASQLHSELTTALEQEVQLSSAQEPGGDDITVWIVPGSVDRDVVQSVLDDHVADPEWGVPAQTRDYMALARKVVADDGYVLSETEIQTAIRGLVLRLQGDLPPG